MGAAILLLSKVSRQKNIRVYAGTTPDDIWVLNPFAPVRVPSRENADVYVRLREGSVRTVFFKHRHYRSTYFNARSPVSYIGVNTTCERAFFVSTLVCKYRVGTSAVTVDIHTRKCSAL